MRTPPPPLQWHPAYHDHTWLLDWLNRCNRYADHHTLRVVFSRRMTFSEPVDPTEPAMIVRTLTREKAWGPAPYVGRPFVYVWHVATDELQRSIAGESWIVHATGEEPS